MTMPKVPSYLAPFDRYLRNPRIVGFHRKPDSDAVWLQFANGVTSLAECRQSDAEAVTMVNAIAAEGNRRFDSEYPRLDCLLSDPRLRFCAIIDPATEGVTWTLRRSSFQIVGHTGAAS